MGLTTSGPLNHRGLSWGLALIQYNKLTHCLLLNRPELSSVHVQLTWQTECRSGESVVVVLGRLLYDCVRFTLRLSRISLLFKNILAGETHGKYF